MCSLLAIEQGRVCVCAPRASLEWLAKEKDEVKEEMKNGAEEQKGQEIIIRIRRKI